MSEQQASQKTKKRKRLSLTERARQASQPHLDEQLLQSKKELEEMKARQEKAGQQDENDQNRMPNPHVQKDTQNGHPDWSCGLDTQNGHAHRACDSDSRNANINSELEESGQAHWTGESDTQDGQAKKEGDERNWTGDLDGRTGTLDTRTGESDTHNGHPNRTGDLDTQQEQKQELLDKPRHIKTKNQKIIAHYLIKTGSQETTYSYLSRYLQVPQASIRKILRKFQELNLIKISKFHSKINNNWALDISVNKDAIVSILSEQELDRQIGQAQWTGDLDTHNGQAQRTGPSYYREKEKNLSIYSSAESLTKDDLVASYPLLYQYGFTEYELSISIKRLKDSGGSGDHVVKALRDMELEIEHFGHIKDRKTGGKAGVGYLVKAISVHGYWKRHPDIEDPEEVALKQEQERIDRIKEAHKEMRRQWATIWAESLSKEEHDMLIGDTSKKTYEGRMALILRKWEANGRPKVDVDKKKGE